jgi:hypothetical protein
MQNMCSRSNGRVGDLLCEERTPRRRMVIENSSSRNPVSESPRPDQKLCALLVLYFCDVEYEPPVRRICTSAASWTLLALVATQCTTIWILLIVTFTAQIRG